MPCGFIHTTQVQGSSGRMRAQTEYGSLVPRAKSQIRWDKHQVNREVLIEVIRAPLWDAQIWSFQHPCWGPGHHFLCMMRASHIYGLALCLKHLCGEMASDTEDSGVLMVADTLPTLWANGSQVFPPLPAAAVRWVGQGPHPAGKPTPFYIQRELFIYFSQRGRGD